MKVSVIVPVYNTGKYLEKCLDSIINQTLKEIEIIVINDGSTEDIDSIVSKYLGDIKYFKNNNHGIGYTRNCGINIAIGEYISFVDSDDYIEKNMLEEMYNYAIKERLEIVVSNYNKITNKKTIEMKLKHFENSNLLSNPEILINIDYGPCNKLFASVLLKNNEIKFVENLKYEDFPFVIKALKCSNKIGHLEESLYNYNVRNNSETTTNNDRNFDIFKIIEIVMNQFKNNDVFKYEVEYLIVSKLLNYNVVQRNISDRNARDKFINKTFKFIKENFPNYKKNKYFTSNKNLKNIIMQNKLFTTLYCDIYSIIKKPLKLL